MEELQSGQLLAPQQRLFSTRDGQSLVFRWLGKDQTAKCRTTVRADVFERFGDKLVPQANVAYLDSPEGQQDRSSTLRPPFSRIQNVFRIPSTYDHPSTSHSLLIRCTLGYLAVCDGRVFLGSSLHHRARSKVKPGICQSFFSSSTRPYCANVSKPCKRRSSL